VSKTVDTCGAILQSSVAEVDNSSKLEESKVQLEKSHGIKPSYIRLEPVANNDEINYIRKEMEKNAIRSQKG
jgi:hypothetical protein